jgi:serine/threonine-protein kinase
MMKIDPELWPTLSRLLDQWLDLPESSRTHWLESLGPEYESVLPELRRLIAAQQGADAEGRLHTLPGMDQWPDSTGNGVFTAGTLVGPYRLVKELGQGGMGVVWLAERADREVKRGVALKLPMVSLHNVTLADRFARERDILASLTHPQIARLYDAGVTDRGQPYLALEYVEGEKITAYCDQHCLGLKPRLQLFLQVLRAAQYAHTNLIVHRDLKPANILVTNEGDVRLLDFGIAKLLTGGEADETELTRLGGRALTPDYASPEQIGGNTITTASDVYSLGVVLYELLTGSRPYKLKRDTRGSLEDAILTTEPARPSHVAVAKRLARSLKGDLDTIVLKALSKQPSARYPTADAFAQDIERYLAGEAVLAQPESGWYRARKFVQRNKLAVGSAAAVVAALSIGLGVALHEAHVARVQTRTAETVRTFLLDIFRANSNEQADPIKARQTTARELLDIGAKKINGALNDAPEAKLGVMETLFRLYADLGLQGQGVPLGRSRVALAKSVYGPNHPELARALVDLAANSGESSFASDRPALLKEAGGILDRSGDFQSRTRALYYLAMGNTVFDTDAAASAAFAAKSVAISRHYPPSRDLVSALNLQGQARNNLEQYDQSIVSLSEAARVANSLQGEARRPLAAIYAILGDSQRRVADFGGAEQSLRKSVEVARAIQGDDSPAVVQTTWRLGALLAQTARPREGLAVLQQAVDLAVRTNPPAETFHTPMARRAYGVHLIRYGRTEEGLDQLDRVIQVRRRTNDSGTHDFAMTLEWAAGGETELGHYRQADALSTEASAIRARSAATPPEELSYALRGRVKLLIATGKAAEAANALRAIPDAPDPAGKIAYGWLNFSVARAEVELAQARLPAAIERTREVRRRIQASGVGFYFRRWDAEAALDEGKGLLLAGHASEALPVLQQAVQVGSEVFDPDRSLELADSKTALAACLLASGRGAEARALVTQVKAIHAVHPAVGEQFRKPLHDLEARLLQRQ